MKEVFAAQVANVDMDDIDMFLDTCEELRLGYLDLEVTVARVTRAYNGKIPGHVYTDNYRMVSI